MESDYNTITLVIKVCHIAKKETVRKWKINNSEGWVKYNEQMKRCRTQGYNEFEKDMNDILKGPVGYTTITPGNSNKINTKPLQNLCKVIGNNRKAST